MRPKVSGGIKMKNAWRPHYTKQGRISVSSPVNMNTTYTVCLIWWQEDRKATGSGGSERDGTFPIAQAAGIDVNGTASAQATPQMFVTLEMIYTHRNLLK
jgi:hypothetical protein